MSTRGGRQERASVRHQKPAASTKRQSRSKERGAERARGKWTEWIPSGADLAAAASIVVTTDAAPAGGRPAQRHRTLAQVICEQAVWDRARGRRVLSHQDLVELLGADAADLLRHYRVTRGRDVVERVGSALVIRADEDGKRSSVTVGMRKRYTKTELRELRNQDIVSSIDLLGATYPEAAREYGVSRITAIRAANRR